MILNHVSVGASDVVKAVCFYDSVLSTLSIKRAHYIENIAAAYGETLNFGSEVPAKEKLHQVMVLMWLSMRRQKKLLTSSILQPLNWVVHVQASQA